MWCSFFWLLNLMNSICSCFCALFYDNIILVKLLNTSNTIQPATKRILWWKLQQEHRAVEIYLFCWSDQTTAAMWPDRKLQIILVWSVMDSAAAELIIRTAHSALILVFLRPTLYKISTLKNRKQNKKRIKPKFPLCLILFMAFRYLRHFFSALEIFRLPFLLLLLF